jgi:pimeloyl-ACP methyl ester carboxylesterase
VFSSSALARAVISCVVSPGAWAVAEATARKSETTVRIILWSIRVSGFETIRSAFRQDSFMTLLKALRSILLLALTVSIARSDPSLFAKPGKLVSIGKGSHLSMYCIGRGSPTIVLESGFGGGTAATWSRLQPLFGELTRTCSYDRAGYGFSRLGSNLPRDLTQSVADLAVLLRRSGERPPYILAGHSNGGLMIGAFADRHPNSVAAMMFFDAAVALPEDLSLTASDSGSIGDSLKAHLERIRNCLARAEKRLVPEVGDNCVDPSWYSGLPADLAAAEIANRAKVDYWRAYLSEAENNYSSKLSEQARALLPHRWMHLPVRVFVASVSQTNDEAAARAFGIDSSDRASLENARSSRARGEQRQERICNGAIDCQIERVPTANHLVHNEALPQVVEAARQLVQSVRRR